MEVKTRKGNLIITLPLEEPRLSASGKTRVVASSRGVRKTTIRIDGQIVSVVANAFVAADGLVESTREEKKTKQIRKGKNPVRRGRDGRGR